MNDNTMSLQNSDTKTRIYNWIKYLCTHHALKDYEANNTKPFEHIPIMLTRECVATKFGISIRQVERHLKSLEEDKLIYRNKVYNNLCIYSLTPIVLTSDLFVRVRP